MAKWQIHPHTSVAVAELEYAYGLEPYPARVVGSTPTRDIGVGASAGFRTLCRKAWEFKSPPAHLQLAEIAQSAEHVIGNDEVPGSIPGLG